MKHSYTVGIGIPLNNDWYWDQVFLGMQERAYELNIQLVSLESISVGIPALPGEEHVNWLEQQHMYGLDALIYAGISSPAWYRILHHNFPIISLTETQLNHPLLIAPQGLDKIAYTLGNFIAQQINKKGHVLIVGGQMDIGEAGLSRLEGLYHAFQPYPDIQIQHIPCLWSYGQAYIQSYPALLNRDTPIDAIVGLIDALAMAARDAAQAFHLLHQNTIIAGFEGTPLAQQAILEGSMHATVDLYPKELGQHSINLAIQAIERKLDHHRFAYQSKLFTSKSSLPIPSTSEQSPQPTLTTPPPPKPSQYRLEQHEIDRIISNLNGTTLERHLLLYGITNLLRTHYAYDHVQIFRWDKEKQLLHLEQVQQDQPALHIPLKDSNILRLAIHLQGSIYICDTHNYDAFPPDPRWPLTRTRIVIPITLAQSHTYPSHHSDLHMLSLFSNEDRYRDKTHNRVPKDIIIGLLDLHTQYIHQPTFEEFGSLENIAVRLGLSMRSAELYQEAQQAKLVALEAQARAEQADQLKTRLLANVSHELRTPLHSLLQHTQTALASTHYRTEHISSSIQQNLEHVVQNARHLTRLIDDLLDLSRSEVDELIMSPEMIATRTFLLETFYGFAPQRNSQQNVTWHIQLPSRLPAIEADPVRLRQILLNLLNNAHKFTSAGHITLGADVASPFLHIWVADTGCGIPHDQHERIFEPFVTGKHSHHKRSGAGLGLSITQRLVLLHNGQIQLESQPLKGSTFHIYLPLSEPSSSLEKAPLDTPIPPAGPTNIILKPVEQHALIQMLEAVKPTASEGVILIVDDDAETCLIYQQLALRCLPSYTCIIAENGQAALHILQDLTPHIVILDLVMPEVDGFTVLEYLRTHPHTRKIPVLILSGHVLDTADVQRLDHMNVSFQSKKLLSNDELTHLFQRLIHTSPLTPQTSILVKQFISHVQHHYTERLSRREMAIAIGVSERHLDRIIQQELGMSPMEYLTRYRLKQAQDLLSNSTIDIRTIASSVGFDDPSYFGRIFRQRLGYSPSAYRKNNL